MNLFHKLNNMIVRLIKYPFIYIYFRHIRVLSVDDTLDTLINTNKSLSRFGNGEFLWILMNNKGSFEKNSYKLRNCLINVLKSKNDNLKIGLPGIINSSKHMNIHYKRYMQMFMVKYGIKFLQYINPNRIYCNTNISRYYMEYNKQSQIDKNYFIKLRKIWKNKNILIIEGKESYLGVKDGLFNNTLSICRIECPPVNAFENYDNILSTAISYLERNKNINLVLLSLGPTATVLAYDLCNKGFRSIDIGHIDVEYNWFLMKAHKKVNIPTRYVNDVKNGGTKVVNIKDEKYKSEIVKRI